MGMSFGDNGTEGDGRSKQWAIFFRTKMKDVATPFAKKCVPIGDGEHHCLAIFDVPDYSEIEYNRVTAYLFRFFPDYEHRSGWRRHAHYERNWNLEILWDQHV